jgi:mRNA-degrading endonuclease toxin of MazEF toxin-antitoxin module
LDYSIDDWQEILNMIENAYIELITSLRRFVNKTDRNNGEDCKRTLNYLQWTKTKTDIILNEKDFDLFDDNKVQLKRGKVVWVDFGFNIDEEFGGRHPAIIMKLFGNSMYCIPVDSGHVPDDKKDKDYIVEIPFIFDMPRMSRWCNVLRLKTISCQRIDFSSPIGRIKGDKLDEINKALDKCSLRGVIKAEKSIDK